MPPVFILPLAGVNGHHGLLSAGCALGSVMAQNYWVFIVGKGRLAHQRKEKLPVLHKGRGTGGLVGLEAMDVNAVCSVGETKEKKKGNESQNER